MLFRIGALIRGCWRLLVVLALLASLPSCANRQAAPHNPAADDLDSARSDFDRNTPPGGD
ncbi:MAG TPA: hypothetical protein VHB99_05020 [Pirellulales bacterium]|nr:hypothetical protein [Pirellulales bacterium]